MWQVYVFNLVAALLIAGWYLRAVRRLERRMDERMRKFDRWADAEDAKYDTARDEIKTSMRAQVDAAIARMNALAARPTADPRSSANGHTDELIDTPSQSEPVEH